MSNDNKDMSFAFSYSAAQQDEVQRIRSRYMPREEDKMETLRRLDASVAKKGTAISLVIGVVSALVLGLGMCCCMVWGGVWFIPGIVIGIVGIAGVAVAYPAYKRITEKERERIAPEIIRLTDELMK